MKKFLPLLLIFGLICFSISAYAQVKRVLLEQHTGAWCGWCVDGTVVMDDILEEHPDRVIGVKIHNGDAMEITEQSTLGSVLGRSGVPSATIDRKSFGGDIFVYRNVWKQHCESVLQEEAKVDLQVFYNIDPDSRLLMAKVVANMIETVDMQLRFNLYIIEDSCSGEGTGWDQSNYLSGRDGYEDNPYYSKPAKITGYQHMKVVRAMLGGAWGEQGNFTKPALSGETYSHDFTFTLPDEWKIKDIWVVGLVQVEESNNKEIVNSAIGKVGQAAIKLTSSGPSKAVLSAGTPLEKIYTLENVSDSEKTYLIELEKSARTPADWAAEVVSGDSPVSQITLAAGETANLALSLTPGATLGAGDVNMKVIVQEDPDGFKGSGSITCYSAEIENFQLLSAGEDALSLQPELEANGYDDFFDIPVNDYVELTDNFTSRDIIIWNTGSSGNLSTDKINTIIDDFNAGKKVFVCGNRAVSDLGNAGALPAFGVSYFGWSTQGYGSAPWRVWLSGIPGDPISGALGETVEGNLIKYLITLMRIEDTKTTTPFMHFKNAGKVRYNNDTLDVAGEDAIFGVKVVKNDTRFVLFSITPYVLINKTVRETLVGNIITWLKNEGPQITTNINRIRYGWEIVGEEKETVVALQNTGNEDLTIDNIAITGSDSYVFDMSMDSEPPITLAPYENHLLWIKFTPLAEADYAASLLIESNSTLNPVMELPIEGEGSLTGINDLSNFNAEISISPNPAGDNSEVQYSFKGNAPVNYSVEIFNSAGTKVADLKNGTTVGGAFKCRITKGLPSGVYFAVLRIGSDFINSPFTIIR